MICVLCETTKVEPTSDDPDFCLACQKRSEEICQNPMLHARANGMIVDALHPKAGEQRDQAVMLGFLSAFYPKMPMKRRMELTMNRDIRGPND